MSHGRRRVPAESLELEANGDLHRSVDARQYAGRGYRSRRGRVEWCQARGVDHPHVAGEPVRTDLERLVRLNQERILMDTLARRLMTEASLTIIDDRIKWSWDSRKNR